MDIFRVYTKKLGHEITRAIFEQNLAYDNNECTTDSCDPTAGRSHTVSTGAPCDDGDPSTASDLCNDEGTCAGTAAATVPGAGCGCQGSGEAGLPTLVLLALLLLPWRLRRRSEIF